MKYFITTDIHGYYSVLMRELNKLSFNGKKDTLITLGDNFDRGNENFEMYQFLTSLSHVILIRGNHEDLFVNMINRGFAYFTDNTNGTMRTLKQLYSHYFSDYDDYYPGDEMEIMGKIKRTDFYKWITNDNIWRNEIRFGNFILTHAGIPTNKKSTEGDWEEARWINPYHNRVPGKLLICGHWHAFYGREINGMKDDVESLYKPYIDKDLIMLDACTPLTHKCNVLIYDDVDGNLYYDGKVVANSNNEVK